MKTEIRGNGTSISLQNPSLFDTPLQTPITGALNGCLGSLDGACIEKLLLHCACAFETNDITLAQQVMWVLNNVASSVGDPNQRLTSWFLRALIDLDGCCSFSIFLKTCNNKNNYISLNVTCVTLMALSVD